MTYMAVLVVVYVGMLFTANDYKGADPGQSPPQTSAPGNPSPAAPAPSEDALP